MIRSGGKTEGSQVETTEEHQKPVQIKVLEDLVQNRLFFSITLASTVDTKIYGKRFLKNK